MDALKITEIALELWGAVFCLIASVCIDTGKKAEHRENIELGYMLVINCIMLTGDAFAVAFRGEKGIFARCVVYLSNYIIFFTLYVLVFMAMKYIYTVFAANGEKLKDIYMRIAGVITAVSVILLTLTQFTGWFYYIDRDNLYHRGKLWFLSQVPQFSILILFVIIVFKYRKKLDTYLKISLYTYIILPVIAMAVQFFCYGISFINIAVTMSLMTMFVMYEVDKSRRMVEQTQRILEQEKMRHEQELGMLRKQIHPHFIFNSMATIQYLCRKDPDQAYAAMNKFSQFLRETIDAYDIEEAIPFEEEMRIVDSYIYLEKLRFDERLSVKKELNATGFSLPALSLQTLIENAIKHGIAKKPEGGTITISSRECQDEYQVEISDDGVGFDISEIKNDGKNHVGLKNVENRLELMCGGRLKLVSRPGMGTCITVHVPK